MVAVMVRQFREMQLRLVETLEHYETQDFKALDSRIASVFNAIYRHAPRNDQEARTMMDFFLDIIKDNDAGDNLHLISRLRMLIDDFPTPCPPTMEISGGAGI